MGVLKGVDIRWLIAAGAIVAAVWFFKDYQYQVAENKRQSENMRQIRFRDSLRYAEVSLSGREIRQELKVNNRELLRKLEENNIRLNRLQRIITQRQVYRDTIKVETRLEGLAQAVVDGVPIAVPIADSTDCWVMRGVVTFDGKEIDLAITERKFRNVTDVVTFWQRRKWSVLGLFQTRFLGKKQGTVKVFNSCGETQAFVIERR